MPVFFWKDPEGDKYRRAYFEKFAGVWAHGDFCVISKETGGIWMLGRRQVFLDFLQKICSIFYYLVQNVLIRTKNLSQEKCSG